MSFSHRASWTGGDSVCRLGIAFDCSHWRDDFPKVGPFVGKIVMGLQEIQGDL